MHYYKYQSDLKRFKESEQTVDLDSEIKIAIEKVAELYKQKEDNVIDLEQAKAKLRVLKEQVGRMDSTIGSSCNVKAKLVLRRQQLF